jgi:hypothetical protein
MTVVYPFQHLPMLGKGSVLLDLLDANGLSTGLRHLGNCTKFELDVKDDEAELYQSINSVPSPIASTVKKRDVTLSITGTDFSSDHMSVVMMASGKTTVATGAVPVAVVAEPLASATAIKKGRFFRTAGRYLDPATIVVHQNAAALVAGTDYVVSDSVKGVIFFPTTSTVDDTKAVTIDYTQVASKSVDTVAAATVPVIKGRLVYLGDPSDGQKIDVDVWTVNLRPNGQLGLIADDYGNWTLDGIVLKDDVNHPASPYYLATFY